MGLFESKSLASGNCSLKTTPILGTIWMLNRWMLILNFRNKHDNGVVFVVLFSVDKYNYVAVLIEG